MKWEKGILKFELNDAQAVDLYGKPCLSLDKANRLLREHVPEQRLKDLVDGYKVGIRQMEGIVITAVMAFNEEDLKNKMRGKL